MTDTDLIAQAEASDKRMHFTEVRQDTVRWEPYKPDGRRQMKARGRWQRARWSGDFLKWENCERPGDIHHEDYDYRDALAAALTRAELAECHAEALEAERDRLRGIVADGASLIRGDAVGAEWKRGCATFLRRARAALTGEPQP